MDEPIYNDIRVYQIDLNFYEFRDFKGNLSKIIPHIIDYHKENFKSGFEVDYSFEQFSKDGCNYSLYTFSEKEKDSVWKDFFPKQLIKDNDFTVKSTSFVLFVEIEEKLFCIIGGKGISVVKRFLNSSFGIDLYEKLADPVNDIVYSQNSRGVSGNLSSEQITYRKEQKLQDALTLGRVPQKINLLLRKEIKDTIFDFISFEEDENVYLEIGTSFCLKKKLNFQQLHDLISNVNIILKSNIIKPLSRFEKVTDGGYIEDSLKPFLLARIRDDMVRLSTPNSNLNMLLDTDFVHPKKLNLFYECDEYKVFFKGEHNPFYVTRDKLTLYKSILEIVYTVVDKEDDFDFRKTILGVRIRGFKDGKKVTDAMFIHHISCEIVFSGKHFFLLDDAWYTVKGDFIKNINDQCFQLIKRNIVQNNPLDIKWNRNEFTEGDYNLMYINRPNYYILDKIIAQNIELCDIIYETDDTIFLIHVKEGFDSKIRDLTNQISISAKRLWNDLKSDKLYLKSIFERYSASQNNKQNISWEKFSNIFSQKEIVYVMAFTSSVKDKTLLESFDVHKSNIAKLSVIQSFRDQSENYQLKIIEILIER